MRNAERGVRNQVSRLTPHGSRNPEGAFRAPHSALRTSSAFTLLELLTVQFPGRKPLKARDILNSRPLAGERFGEVMA